MQSGYFLFVRLFLASILSFIFPDSPIILVEWFNQAKGRKNYIVWKIFPVFKPIHENSDKREINCPPYWCHVRWSLVNQCFGVRNPFEVILKRRAMHCSPQVNDGIRKELCMQRFWDSHNPVWTVWQLHAQVNLPEIAGACQILSLLCREMLKLTVFCGVSWVFRHSW